MHKADSTARQIKLESPSDEPRFTPFWHAQTSRKIGKMPLVNNRNYVIFFLEFLMKINNFFNTFVLSLEFFVKLIPKMGAIYFFSIYFTNATNIVLLFINCFISLFLKFYFFCLNICSSCCCWFSTSIWASELLSSLCVVLFVQAKSVRVILFEHIQKAYQLIEQAVKARFCRFFIRLRLAGESGARQIDLLSSIRQ